MARACAAKKFSSGKPMNDGPPLARRWLFGPRHDAAARRAAFAMSVMFWSAVAAYFF